MTATIIILGNPVDGFTFVGPFDSRDEAIEYGQDIAEEWCVAPIQDPEAE